MSYFTYIGTRPVFTCFSLFINFADDRYLEVKALPRKPIAPPSRRRQMRRLFMTSDLTLRMIAEFRTAAPCCTRRRSAERRFPKVDVFTPFRCMAWIGHGPEELGVGWFAFLEEWLAMRLAC